VSSSPTNQPFGALSANLIRQGGHDSRPRPTGLKTRLVRSTSSCEQTRVRQQQEAACGPTRRRARRTRATKLQSNINLGDVVARRVPSSHLPASAAPNYLSACPAEVTLAGVFPAPTRISRDPPRARSTREDRNQFVYETVSPEQTIDAPQTRPTRSTLRDLCSGLTKGRGSNETKPEPGENLINPARRTRDAITVSTAQHETSSSPCVFRPAPCAALGLRIPTGGVSRSSKTVVAAARGAHVRGRAPERIPDHETLAWPCGPPMCAARPEPFPPALFPRGLDSASHPAGPPSRGRLHLR